MTNLKRVVDGFTSISTALVGLALRVLHNWSSSALLAVNLRKRRGFSISLKLVSVVICLAIWFGAFFLVILFLYSFFLSAFKFWPDEIHGLAGLTENAFQIFGVNFADCNASKPAPVQRVFKFGFLFDLHGSTSLGVSRINGAGV